MGDAMANQNQTAKILLAGYYGYGNIGDELILQAVSAQLRKKWIDPDIVVLSRRPWETRKKTGLRSVFRWNPVAIFRHLRKSDLFLLGGGGLFQDATSARSNYYYLGLMALARLCRVPVFLYAIGVETVAHPGVRRKIQALLSDDNIKITVRDIESKENLVQMGVSDQRIFVTADPVFNLDIQAGWVQEKEQEPPYILVIPRWTRGTTGRTVFQSVVRALGRLQGVGMKGLLFQKRKEKKFKKMLQNVEWPANGTEAGGGLNKLMELMAKSRLVVSARYHGLVLAALLGKPFVGVGSPDKVGRLCRAWGMPFVSWNADEREITEKIKRIENTEDLMTSRPVELFKQAASLTVELTSTWFKTLKKS